MRFHQRILPQKAKPNPIGKNRWQANRNDRGQFGHAQSGAKSWLAEQKYRVSRADSEPRQCQLQTDKAENESDSIITQILQI